MKNQMLHVIPGSARLAATRRGVMRIAAMPIIAACLPSSSFALESGEAVLTKPDSEKEKLSASGSGAALVESASRLTYSMGTLVALQVYGPRKETAEAWLSAALDEVQRLVMILSVHEEGTPVRKVMENSGTEVEIPEDLAEVAAMSLAVARESDGAFDPTIGKLVDVWRIGFGGDRVPTDDEIREALSLVDWRRIRLSERDGRHFMCIGGGQDLDFGAIAKGYIGTRAAGLLKSIGASSALLSLGGNVVLLGGSPEGRPWRIGLQDPAHERNDYFAVLEASDTSIVTSGAYERNIEVGGRTYGHILSARTGWPVETDLSSVTIVDRDGAKADAWCTALFGMGSEGALGLLAGRPDIEAVLLSADRGTAWITDGLKDACSVTSPDVKDVRIVSRGR